MRVVLFDFKFEPDKPGITGLSDIVWNWARNLAVLGDEVHIVAPYPEDTQVPEGVIVNRFPVPPAGYRNIVGHMMIALRGWLEIRKLGRVDLVQAPEYLSTAIFSLLGRRTPCILSVPGNIYERIEHGNPFDWTTTQVYKVAAKLSARLCTRIIVTSRDMRQWWQKTGAEPSRMVLIPTGVDTQRFYPVPQARRLLGLPEDEPIVLYVGRLSHEKGVHVLVEALQRASKHISGLRLVLVGEGPFRVHLLRLVQQLGMDQNVVFRGWVEQQDLPVYYSAADVTVLPSFSEGLPRTMLEAMACGSPFLGTRITGIVDHVQDGETGFLVSPGDVEELAAKLLDILKNKGQAKDVGRRARDYICQTLDWKVIVERMRSEVYERLVTGNGG